MYTAGPCPELCRGWSMESGSASDLTDKTGAKWIALQHAGLPDANFTVMSSVVDR